MDDLFVVPIREQRTFFLDGTYVFFRQFYRPAGSQPIQVR